jgi:hypothetical protein
LEEVENSLMSQLSLEELSEIAPSIASRVTLQRELRRLTEGANPRATVGTLPERGFKCRTVTCSPGSLVALLHLVRQMLLKLLRTVPEVQEVLAGNRRHAVE